MKYFFSTLLLCCAGFLAAQNTYSINASGKNITFRNVTALTIEGTSAGEMTIEREGEYKVDERAKGLRKISATGVQDNTGFGVSVSTGADGIVVEQVGNKNNRLVVKVPNSATVTVNSLGTNCKTLIVNDFGGELDITHEYNSIKLNNVTGPLAASAIYGRIEAVFNTVPTQDIQLTSTYSDVDITLPATTKADLVLKTDYGSMYTDFDLNVPANTENKVAGLEAQINGGGIRITLTSPYDDIYLRKK